MAKFDKEPNSNFHDVSEDKKLYSRTTVRVGSSYIGKERLGEELFPEGDFEEGKVNLTISRSYHEGISASVKVSGAGFLSGGGGEGGDFLGSLSSDIFYSSGIKKLLQGNSLFTWL